MFDDKARVLLILPQETLDRARVFVGETITKFKGPVSLQMVLRALIDEGLKRRGDRAILANIDAQVRAVRELRSRVRRAAPTRRSAPATVRSLGRAPK
jgi:hypothetical protein